MKVGGQEGAFRVRVGELKSALRDGLMGVCRGQANTIRGLDTGWWGQ